MTDLIKALLIGVALVAGILAIPVVIAIAAPMLAFAALIFLIWFALKVITGEDPSDRTDPPP